jgi:hypothetical protein
MENSFRTRDAEMELGTLLGALVDEDRDPPDRTGSTAASTGEKA